MRLIRTVAICLSVAVMSSGGGFALAQEQQIELGEYESTYCWYYNHPTTGLIAQYCEDTYSSGATIGYWVTDGTEPQWA